MDQGTPNGPAWLDLDGDERIVLRAAPSTNLVLASLILGVVLMLAMSIVVGFYTDVATGRAVSFVVLIAIVLLIAGAFLVTKRREYVVTSQRACAAVGFAGKTVSKCPLDEIRELSVEQTGWQRLFRVGTLRFVSGDGELRFALVEHPMRLQQRLLPLLDGLD